MYNQNQPLSQSHYDVVSNCLSDDMQKFPGKDWTRKARDRVQWHALGEANVHQ